MEFQRTWHGATVDGHVHMGPMDEESVLLDIMGAAGIGQAALASIQDPQRGAGLGRAPHDEGTASEAVLRLRGAQPRPRLSAVRSRGPIG